MFLKNQINFAPEMANRRKLYQNFRTYGVNRVPNEMKRNLMRNEVGLNKNSKL
jgi:hypothetical protein